MAIDELTLEQALAELVAWLPRLGETESVVLREAAGRVLAADVVAATDLPGSDNSAMDGYALRAADLRPGHWLHEIGRAYAGHPFAGSVETGTCVRVMTGAPIPTGSDTVVMLEDVVAEAGTVQVARTPPAGANIRRRGEHVHQGERVLLAGRRLSAADIGLAAAAGAAGLDVRRRLRVGVVSTGDELADPPSPLPAAGSFDANRPLLCASLGFNGFDVHDLGICADTAPAFAATIDHARSLRLDVVLASGGAAQGDADIVRAASGVRFLALNIRPGRGIAVAQPAAPADPLVLLGLPGNAVAAFVMFHLLARPLLEHLAGAPAAIPLHLPMRLSGDVRLRGGRVDYRRARFVRDSAGQERVEPLRDQGSAMLRTVTEADALLALGPQDAYADGDWVPTVPMAMLG